MGRSTLGNIATTLIALALLLSGTASGVGSGRPAADYDEQAQDMLSGCHAALKEPKEAQTFQAGVCFGVIKGLHYLSRDVCVPPGSTLTEIATIITKYADAHPDRTEDD